MTKIRKTDQEWAKELSPERFRVTRQKGTEPAFTGEYYATKDEGVYLCACCGTELFRSEQKYDSGSGWPSFWLPAKENAVATADDRSQGMRRIEITCSRCDAHLGHVFEDGPDPTGLRYCVNSLSLKLERDKPKT